MRDEILNLLREMEKAIPPPLNCHHCLTYSRYGSDEKGWEEKLALQINSGGTFTCYFLEEADLALDPAALAAEVKALRDEPGIKWQQGVAQGQYVP